ncbi:hypothetical protein B9J78_06190 [bacterium Unc6]|nr:hypothetical protein [bacterium Unc6]MBT9129968.1 Metal cation efflux system protein CzcD [Candidatus Psychracetigena formicireducens]
MIHFHRPKIKSQDLLHKYRLIERRKLKTVMTITGTMMIVEVIGGLLTGSLALLSDAGHMFTHFFCLRGQLCSYSLCYKRGMSS